MLSADPTSLIVMVPGLLWALILSVLLVFSPRTVPQVSFIFLVPGGSLVMLCWRYISYRRKVLTYFPVEAEEIVRRQPSVLEYEYRFEGTKYRGTAAIVADDDSIQSVTVMVDPKNPSRSFIRELFCKPRG